MTPLVEIDGTRPTPEELLHPALVNYGHFTAMQVRGGAVRGLDLHLARLRDAHFELFGTEVDTGRVRRLMRRAVAARADTYLRVTLYEAEPGAPRVMTVIRPAIDVPATPQSLTPVAYMRPFPHIKHVGSFAQIRHGLLAERAGFDDALLVTDAGLVTETTTANIGFVDGGDVVWPAAPCLRGITWQLLDAGLAERGREARSEDVTLDTIDRFEAVFLANSIGVAPVARIGAREFDAADPRVAELVDVYRDVPWDTI
ncbi:MAG: aminotransferase class IV [Jatrophihabitantaceae bacterium]